MSVAAQPLGEFLAALGAKTPSPGGGATAAVAGALGAAQLRMVAEYGTWEAGAASPAPRLGELATALAALAHEDAVAYAAYAVARPKRKEDPAGWARVQEAIADVPARVLEHCLEAAEHTAAALARAPKWFASDAAIAAACLLAGADGARSLCGSNVEGLAAGARAPYEARLAALDARSAALRRSLSPLLLARLPAH